MKYVIWFVRAWYVAWMIPAGIEHFYHIYPQPGANSPHPLAAEMLGALLSTHLFDLVKAVELLTGLAILFGYFTPLALLACMPVAFCVWWWDAPLSEWSTGSLIAGSRVLASNLFLSLAYIASLKAMFTLRASPSGTSPLPARAVPVLRVVFGAWMFLNGVSHFFFPLWQIPLGQTPLSQQLMAALVHSQMLDVCMLIELVAGALILLGVWVPVALCTLMAVSTSALFWAVLDHQPLALVLGLLAFALNGLLMLAYLPYYQGALARAPLSWGESAGASWNALFVQSKGRTSRQAFMLALVPLWLAVLWYVNKGPKVDYAPWGVLVLLYPAAVLHVRRLHDMGLSSWLGLVPTLLAVVAMLIWAHWVSLGAQLDAALPWAALVAFVALGLWGSVRPGQAEPNRYGPPVGA